MPRAVEALLNASTWPGYGLQVGRAEDAQRTQQKRRMTELFQCSSRPMLYMCSEERNSECTGGLWRPGIGSSALLTIALGRLVMSQAQVRLKTRLRGQTKKFRIWTKCHCNTSIKYNCILFLQFWTRVADRTP